MIKFHNVALSVVVSLTTGLWSATIFSQAIDVGTKVSASAGTQMNFGRNAIVQADIKDINEAADKKVQRTVKAATTPTVAVNKKIIAYLKDKKLRAGGTTDDKGRVVFYKVMAVDGNKASSDYVRLVEVAYEKAYLNALKDFSNYLANKTTSEISQEFFNDDSSNAGEFKNAEGEEVSKIQAIGEKILALTEAQLNNALQKAGVDPSQYASRPKDQKLLLLKDVLTAKIKSATSIQMSGITILDNFITVNEQGEAAVGVVLMHSPVTQNLALCLKNSTPPNLKAVGPSLEDQLPMDDEEKMSDFFGSRLLIDENGPVVVSFGFWSVKKSNNPTIQGRLVAAAEKQAAGIARSNLSQFLSLAFTSEDNETRSTSLTQYAVKNGQTGAVDPSVVENIVQSIVDEKSRLKSSANLAGARNILNWQYEDPDDGHLTVGVVLAYSMNSITNAANIRNNQHNAVMDSEKETSTSPVQETKARKDVSKKSAVSTALDVF